MDEIAQNNRNEGNEGFSSPFASAFTSAFNEAFTEAYAEGKAEVVLIMVDSGRMSLSEASDILGVPISEVTRLGREKYPNFPEN